MEEKAILEIKDLHVTIDDKEILKGVNLTVKEGEIHALMGPNGSGKSTLANTIMGHPKYTVTKGKILFNGEDITDASPDKRAQAGLFLVFQYPQALSGVTLSNFLRTALTAKNGGKPIRIMDFMKNLQSTMEDLNMNKEFVNRHVNEGFSGGERKKNEIVQMSLLKPRISILDEPDSGLDVDALKDVTKGLNKLHNETNMGMLLITHYQRILTYIKPDHVHVMANGKIVLSGESELAEKIEKEGYDEIIKLHSTPNAS